MFISLWVLIPMAVAFVVVVVVIIRYAFGWLQFRLPF